MVVDRMVNGVVLWCVPLSTVRWRVSDHTYLRKYDTCDRIDMGLSWMPAPLSTVYVRRLFWDLFG